MTIDEIKKELEKVNAEYSRLAEEATKLMGKRAKLNQQLEEMNAIQLNVWYIAESTNWYTCYFLPLKKEETGFTGTALVFEKISTGTEWVTIKYNCYYFDTKNFEKLPSEKVISTLLKYYIRKIYKESI